MRVDPRRGSSAEPRATSLFLLEASHAARYLLATVKPRIVLILVVVIAAGALAAILRARYAAESNLAREADLARQDLPELAARRTVLTQSAVEPGQNFSDVLDGRALSVVLGLAIAAAVVRHDRSQAAKSRKDGAPRVD